MSENGKVWYDQIKQIDVGSDGKLNTKKDKDLRQLAIQTLSDIEIRKLPPEQFNRMVEGMKELLKRRDVDAEKIKDFSKQERLKLSLEVSRSGKSDGKETSKAKKGLNLLSEGAAKLQIMYEKAKGNDYLLGYDKTNLNYIYQVSSLENDLKTKPIETINGRLLASYLEHLDDKGKLNSFLKNLSQSNKELLASLWFMNEGQIQLVPEALKRDKRSDIMEKLKPQFSDVIVEKFGNIEAKRFVYNKYKDKIKADGFEKFSGKFNKCKSAVEIFNLLKTYKIDIKTAKDVTELFGRVISDIGNREKFHSKKKHEKQAEAGLNDLSKVKDLHIKSKKFDNKKIIDLNANELSDIRLLIHPDNKKQLEYIDALIKQKTNQKTDVKLKKDAKQLAKKGSPIATAAAKAYNDSTEKNFEKAFAKTVAPLIDLGEKEDSIGEKYMKIINRIPGFENISSISELTSVEQNLEKAIKYLTNKLNKTQDELGLLKELKGFRKEAIAKNYFNYEKSIESGVKNVSVGTKNQIAQKGNEAIRNEAKTDDKVVNIPERFSSPIERREYFAVLLKSVDSHPGQTKEVVIDRHTNLKISLTSEGNGKYSIKYPGANGLEKRNLDRKDLKNAISLAKLTNENGLNFLLPNSTNLIESLNKKGCEINEDDGIEGKEKSRFLNAIGKTLITGYIENGDYNICKNQFATITNESIKQKDTALKNSTANISSIETLAKIKFPGDNKEFNYEKFEKALIG